ncbi:flippase activity-associated protein Agl23 [Occallatibacter savannae]|uniref:flippase activity-associated protein Agl23 n=1 Tax=Occallatibacter savannae TaxID=1002691 RepID=UPI0013A592EF|nr:flippase activity-associated protein Agl23 [Occallatibacter savannae]
MRRAIHSRTRWLPFIFVALLGLAVRLPQLGERPMHTDEAINGYIVGQLLSGEPFRYDSVDRHGPALSLIALPLARIQGARSFSDLTESELRLAPVLAGCLTILLFGAAVDLFGFLPCLVAALLFAFGPLPLYYDRYFIHESLFCAATFGLILSGWRAWSLSSLGYAALAGACGALMLAAKETAFLHFVALAVAAIVFGFWSRPVQRSTSGKQLSILLIASGTFVALSVLLYTWFGRNWSALHALFGATPHLVSRAGGQGHAKPFWYFAQLLTSGQSGAVVTALACIRLFAAMRRSQPSSYTFIAIYLILIGSIYSLIPYKTPWLALNLWLPLALLAGGASEMLWQAATSHAFGRVAIPALGVLAVLVAASIAHDTRERVFLHPADEQNPYAYAHTTDDILGLPAEISELARRAGITSPRIAVIASDPWPLPWYLRHFSQVGFWQPSQQPAHADFYITSTDSAEQYRDLLKDYRADFFGVRPGVLILLWLPAPK